MTQIDSKEKIEVAIKMFIDTDRDNDYMKLTRLIRELLGRANRPYQVILTKSDLNKVSGLKFKVEESKSIAVKYQ